MLDLISDFFEMETTVSLFRHLNELPSIWILTIMVRVQHSRYALDELVLQVVQP